MKNNSRILYSIILFSFLSNSLSAQFSDSPYDKINSALQIISYAYVDSVVLDEVVEHGIIGMLKELDPHSQYISKADLKAANEPLEGSFDGIGVQFQIFNDTVMVISPISGGPSEKLGIQAGDKFLSIEGKSVAGVKIKNEDVFKALRGVKGTKVNVALLKVGSHKIVEYTITRDKIPIFSVDATYMIDKEIGYIKVSRFAQTTAEEFREAISKLRSKGMTNLILDLTDNGGGIMQAAVEMADEFLGDKKLIVYQQGQFSPKQSNYATNKGGFETGKLVVLIDEGSASASEIVSGAVQDWDRGLIIGRRSFGKGLVQRPFNLADGSQIRLTVARYYTPIGRNIQKPYEDGIEKYYKDLRNRGEHGEFYSEDSIHFPDSLKFFTPNKRVVYGGGGIMPDIFVPLDSSKSSTLLTDLFRKGIVNRFTLTYVDRERSKLKAAYPSANQYIANFKTDAKFMDEFFEFAAKDSVFKVNDEYEKSKDIIHTQLKARIAQDLFGNDAMFEIINKINPPYLKAIEAIQNETFSKLKIANK